MSDPRYSTERWRRMRRLHLQRMPFCEMCQADGGRLQVGNNVDHVIPHRGNEALFWNGALQTLCDTHHNAAKQREEVNGYSGKVNESGFPTDPRHPFNEPKRK